MVTTTIRSSDSDGFAKMCIYIAVTLFFISILYPLYFVVIASVSDPMDVYNGKVTVAPSGFSMKGYKKMFEYREIWSGYRNTVFYTALYSALSVLVTFMAGYPLSQKDLIGRKFITGYFIITMFFTGGLIPTYLVVRSVGLVGGPANWLSMILPTLVSVWYIIIARTFIQTSVPSELFESASIEGCGHSLYFWKILMPLSKAGIAVIALFSAVGKWNDFFSALIYLQDRRLYPLQLILREILIATNASQNMSHEFARDVMEEQAFADLIKYGAIIVSSLPLLIVYPFLQKYFVNGVMIGSIKG